MDLNDKNFVWQCRQILAQNAFKIYFSVITVFVIWILTVIGVYLVSFSSGNILSISLMFFAGWFCSMVVGFSLVYGYDLLLLKIVKNEQAVLGHLFEGFRQLKRMVRPGLFFAAVFFVLSVTGSIGLIAIRGDDALNPDTMAFVAFFIIIAFALVCFIYIFFPFLWQTQQDSSISRVLAQSRLLLKGNRLAFIRNFIIFAWKSLCIFILSYICIAFLQNRIPESVSAIFSFTGTISAYITAVKFFLLAAVFYYRLTANPDTETFETDNDVPVYAIESDINEENPGTEE